jgi:hypothetical protein
MRGSSNPTLQGPLFRACISRTDFEGGCLISTAMHHKRGATTSSYSTLGTDDITKNDDKRRETAFGMKRSSDANLLQAVTDVLVSFTSSLSNIPVSPWVYKPLPGILHPRHST